VIGIDNRFDSHQNDLTGAAGLGVWKCGFEAKVCGYDEPGKLLIPVATRQENAFCLGESI